jgi:plastocyanin
MKKNNLRIWLGVIVVLALIAIVVRLRVAARPANASSVEVNIDNFTYSPTSLVVRVGTQITWTNRDDIPHTVVENGKVFKSKVLDTNEKFTFRPEKAGTYKYYCSIHPKMTAEVVVE